MQAIMILSSHHMNHIYIYVGRRYKVITAVHYSFDTTDKLCMHSHIVSKLCYDLSMS